MSALATKLDPRASEATRQLFETHRRRIFGYCVGQLGNHHDAEDAVQTTFLYAFGCLERGVVPEAELAWLYKIALNVCRTRRRSLGRRRRIEAPTDLDACEYAMAAPERGDDELPGLSGAIAGLPNNQRSALLLREWQGLSYAEIAERLTVSQSAVETLLFRARRTLASQLRRVPQQVAMIANAPLLVRLLRRLAPNAGALKTTATLVAIGAVSTAGGQELRHGFREQAPVKTPASHHAPARVFSAPAPSLRALPSPAAVKRPARLPRIAAPSDPIAAPAAAASPAEVPATPATPAAPAAPHATPEPAAPEPAAPEPAAPPPMDQPAPAPPSPQVALPTPTLSVELPAVTVGELAASASASASDDVASVVEAVTGPVLPISVPDPTRLLPLPDPTHILPLP
jgi:RNA polymerase sigma-70 factor (ECF subfamily)